MSAASTDGWLRDYRQPGGQFRPLQMVHEMDLNMRLDLEPWEQDRERLTAAQVADRFGRMRDAGVGGVVVNVAYEDYLESDQAWGAFRDGIQAARDAGLEVWVYDEKGYPSGTAGGQVTRSNPTHAALGLACYLSVVDGPAVHRSHLPASCRRTVFVGAVVDTASPTAADIVDLTHCLDDREAVQWEVPEGRWTVFRLAERVMYEGTHGTSNASEFRPMANLIDPEAVRSFLRLTHERYHRELGPDLWRHVAAVFTDEPSLMTCYLGEPAERFRGKIPVLDRPLFGDRPPAVPWRRDMPRVFEGRTGRGLPPLLYALFFSDSQEAVFARQAYWDLAADLFTEAFHAQIAAWCRGHGTALTGHGFAEEGLTNHVRWHGDLMRGLRAYDIPGVDMLGANTKALMNSVGFIGPLQAASAAALTGATRVQCEASDWGQRNAGQSATLEQRIGQANWLYALGVNRITSYYSWDDIAPEDWRRYNDHVGRLGAMLSGGRRVCDVGILYPIRSAWRRYVPDDADPRLRGEATGRAAVDRVSRLFTDTIRSLLRSQIDVQIVDEQGLREATVPDGRIQTGRVDVGVVIVPGADAVSVDAMRALDRFSEAGGAVCFLDPLPCAGASPGESAEVAAIADRICGRGRPRGPVPAEAVVATIRRLATRDIVLTDPVEDVVYCHYAFEDRHVYFVTNTGPDPLTVRAALSVPGPYVTCDPADGKVSAETAGPEMTLGPYSGQFAVCPHAARAEEAG